MLKVDQLSKNYGENVAVDNISFSAGKGTVFGLLGPNGAGKSTTINCISGLLRPTSGHAAVAGHDVVADGKAARQNLGVVPQEIALYEDLAAVENLRFWGKAYGLRGAALESRVSEVLEYIGLGDRAKDLPKEFSGGMKRRLNFGCGIVHRPPVILLDEVVAAGWPLPGPVASPGLVAVAPAEGMPLSSTEIPYMALSVREMSIAFV